MLNYFDVIKAQSGIPVDDIWAQLWGNTMSTEYIISTYSGTLPATLTGTKVGHLEQYKIYGNTVQDGTPTPENPIMPIGCGELETTGAHAGQYKLPLTVNGVEYPIYLGENQTTRKIKKLVLTGEENCYRYVYVGANGIEVSNVLDANYTRANGFCSHYPVYPQSISNSNSLWIGVNSKSLYFVGILDVIGISSVSDFKSYLAAQYAAGTPVTVWYVLAEPETGIVNEPLMKIGDYADTIDSTQSTVQIPTVAGSTTISWAGEGLAPSEVELTYKGLRR